MSSTSSPPPYSQVAPTTASDRERILNNVLSAANSPQVDHSWKRPAERLREFLLHLLIIDYEAGKKMYFSSTDRDHWLAIAGNIMDFQEYSEAANSEDRALLANYFNIHVFEPARLLGVPAQMVMQRLVVFRHCISPDGDYFGCMQFMFRNDTISNLASKFQTDELVLIPRLIPPFDNLRKSLLDRLYEVRGLYFRHVEAPDDGIVITPDGQTLRHLGGMMMVETEYLKRHRDAAGLASCLRPRPQNIAELTVSVRQCLSRLSNKNMHGYSMRQKNNERWMIQGPYSEIENLSLPKFHKDAELLSATSRWKRDADERIGRSY